MDKNQFAMATAYKKAVAKNRKIKELDLSPKMTVKAVDKVILTLAKAKAEKDGDTYITHLKGQRWYVEDLIVFSGLDPEAQFELEYQNAFPDVAGETELIAGIAALKAAC